MNKPLNYFVPALAVAFVALSGSVGIGQAVQPGALVAHYSFNETSGTTAANTATLSAPDAVQDSGSVSWVSGVLGGAGDFSGNTDLFVGDLFSGSTPTAFTLSAWVNPDAIGSYVGIFASRASNFGLNANPNADNSLSGARFDYRFDNAAGGSQGLDSADQSAVNGAWHHLAMTWQTDGTVGTGEYFLNGTLLNGLDVFGDGSLVLGTPSGGTTAVYGDDGVPNWYIGSDNGRNINAQLDDFAAWNVALTAAEVNTVYNNGLMNIDAFGTFGGIPGDVNGDLAVDSLDFQIISDNIFDPAFDATPAVRTQGDLNGDGFVTYVDFAEWKNAAAAQSLASVPEPSSCLLLVTCLAAFIGGVRRSRR